MNPFLLLLTSHRLLAQTGSRIWPDKYSSRLDLIIPYRSNAAGHVPQMPVADTVLTVRRAAGVGASPTALCALHR